MKRSEVFAAHIRAMRLPARAGMKHLEQAYPRDCVACGYPISETAFRVHGLCDRHLRHVQEQGALELGSGVEIRKT